MRPHSPRISRLALPMAVTALLLAGVSGALGAESAPKPAPTPNASVSASSPKDLAELKALEDQVKQVAARLTPCTVGLRVGDSQGSGVIVSKDGLVLTAGHVIGQPNQATTFVFSDGRTAKGTTLGVNQDGDAGLAKITDKGEWPFVEMRKAGTIQPGMWCIALGHPLGIQEGRPPVVRLGRVLMARDTIVQSDCTIVAGDSGGPLVDLDGRVIGINSRITAGMTNMNFHVSIDTFHESWQRLLKGEVWHTHIEGRDSRQLKGIFQPAIAEASRCVVRVKCDGKDAALGTIVGPDGWVLTKASQLKGKIACRFRDDKELEARIVGVHDGFDLAMLKIDAAGLPLIRWGFLAKQDVGQWVATPGPGDGPPIALGVISVPQRRIPPTNGVLGVTLGEPDSPARITQILPDSSAKKAGLQENDVVTHLDDKPTKSRNELISAIKQLRPGTKVKLTVKRGEKVLEILATLSRLETPASRKRDMQNLAGLGVNRRSDDFPKVLQHDTVLHPNDCGGPLVDLSGQVIGVNIARAGRTETYAVPADALPTLLYDLMSGRLAPKPEVKPAEAKPESKPEAKPAAKPEAKAEPKPEATPEPKPQPKADSGKPEPKEAPKQTPSQPGPSKEEPPKPNPPQPIAKPQPKPVEQNKKTP